VRQVLNATVLTRLSAAAVRCCCHFWAGITADVPEACKKPIQTLWYFVAEFRWLSGIFGSKESIS